MSHRIVLDVQTMDGPTERREFQQPKVAVGADPANDIVVTNRRRPDGIGYVNCSRRHGMFEVRDNDLVLHDMGTANGWHMTSRGPLRENAFRLSVGESYYVGDTKITIVSYE